MQAPEEDSKKTSPFRRPDDKDVFLARDTEKQKRIEAKEKAKSLKIWDKNTATSRLHYEDIPPADANKTFYAMKNKDIIDQAKNICKSRVQYPKDTRSQNAFEFVEQKKEMFLVQLSHNTIKSEIDLLSQKISRKKDALENSAKLLNDDEKIKLQQKNKQKERKDKEEMLKEIESQIQNFNSELIKHRDTLENLEKHKTFLLNLSDGDFIREQERIKQNKIQTQLDKYLKDNLDKSKSGDQKEREKVTKEFYEKLSNYLIDIPQDFYHEEIQFKDPEEISDKFAELETSNLFLIHNRQEVEQGFEELKAEERQMIEELSKKKRAYERNLEKLEVATKASSEVYK